MIPASVVNAFTIALLSTTILPIAILIYLAVKKKINGRPLLFGFLAFFASQMLLRLPLLSVISGMEWFDTFAGQFIPFALFLSFTAGLFEESARLGGALLLKYKRSYKDAISFGLGHGFCEVIMLIGLTHINNVVLCMAVNNPGDAMALAMAPELLGEAAEVLAGVNPLHVYLGIFERVFAVIFHVFATVLVFLGVVKKKWIYFIMAIGAHTLFNFIAVLLANYVNIYVSEAAILVMALAAGWYTLKCKPFFDMQVEVIDQPATP